MSPQVARGQRFGMLVVVGSQAKLPSGHLAAVCQCDCGVRKTVRMEHLTRERNYVRSCGCNQGKSNYKHGLGALGRRPPEYVIWLDMRDRCNRPAKKTYARYGGRGIRVCERWNDFTVFLNDMGPRPSKHHSIERMDNNGNYEPGNCRWATLTEQARNKRSNRRIEIDGVTLTVVEWSERVGIKANTISSRLYQGWPERDAVTAPLGSPHPGIREM